MRKELEEKLYEKYPKIFAGRNLPPSKSRMGDGLCHDDGWYDIIDSLCHFLQSQSDMNGYRQFVAHQIKEKGGTLRFRGTFEDAEKSLSTERDRPDEYLLGAIRFAEQVSAFTCERCGGNGRLTTDEKYIQTLCRPCLDAEQD